MTAQPLRGDAPRLYEVDRRGRVQPAPVPAVLERHAQRVRAVWLGSVALNSMTMGAAALAYVVGGRLLGAGFGLAALAALPTLAAAPLLWRIGPRRPPPQ